MVRTKSVVHIALLLSGVAVSVSGFVLQAHYHLMKNPDVSAVWGLDRNQWNGLHTWGSIGFLGVVLYHVWAHRKWVRGVIRRRLFAKNRPTVFLSLVATTTVVTALISLFSIGSLVVEIHDKVAILFFILALGHTIKRKRKIL